MNDSATLHQSSKYTPRKKVSKEDFSVGIMLWATKYSATIAKKLNNQPH